jgi:hypothetical protein
MLVGGEGLKQPKQNAIANLKIAATKSRLCKPFYNHAALPKKCNVIMLGALLAICFHC